MARLAQAAVEAADGVVAFLNRDDRVRDAFPLPSADEREKWFQFWDNDVAGWETVSAQVLGKVPPYIRLASKERKISWSFDRTERFFGADEKHLDSFFRCLEVRFVLRAFWRA